MGVLFFLSYLLSANVCDNNRSMFFVCGLMIFFELVCNCTTRSMRTGS